MIISEPINLITDILEVTLLEHDSLIDALDFLVLCLSNNKITRKFGNKDVHNFN